MLEVPTPIEAEALGAPQAPRELSRHEHPLQRHATVPQWWRELFERSPGASVFLSPTWMQTWLEVYGKGLRGSWLRWQAGSETVGGCLLLRRTVWRRRWPLATVFVNASEETGRASPTTEFNQILHLPGYEDAIAADLALAIGGMRWTCLELPAYEDSALTRSLLARLPLCGHDRVESPSRYVDLEAVKACGYEATLSGKTRSQIRRCRRMYEETYGPLAIERAAECEEALAYLDQLAILHNSAWRSRGATGAFASSAFMTFHRRLVRGLWPTRAVDVLRVRAGTKVIGYLYNFLRGGKVYCYQSGFVQEQDNNLKPGMLSHACAIGHYLERGYREYDFLAGDMRYKRSLAKWQRTLLWSVAYRRGLYARAALLARAAARRLFPSGPAHRPEPQSATD